MSKTLGEVAVALGVVWGLSMGTGALCWPYVMNSWLEFAGREPTAVWWMGAILGLYPRFGYVSLPLAGLTWVLLLFLGGSA